MHPFSVTCETCGARLKVRDESLVGEIHSCPKCTSMVLIVLPESFRESHSPESSIGGPEPLASGPETATESKSSLPEFAAEVDDLLHSAAIEDTSAGLDTPPIAEGLPDAAIASSSAIVLWSAVAGTVILATTLGAYIWFSSRAEQSVAPLVATQTNPAENEPTKPAEDDPQVENLEPSDAPIDDQEVRGEGQSQLPEGVPQEVQKPTIAEKNTAEPLPPVASPIEALPEADANDPSQDEAVEASEPAPAIPAYINPLGIDPADLDLLLVPKSAPQQPQITQEPPAQPPTDSAVHVEPQPDPLGPPPQPRRFEPGSAALGPSFAEQFPSTTLPARLDARIPMIRWSNAPLQRALSELSQLSGVTIQIDPDTLRMALIRANHPITLSQQDATVDSIVNSIATSLRLKPVPVDDALILEKPDMDTLREVSYPIDDLAANETLSAALTELVRQFGVPSADSSEITLAGGRLVIQQPARDQYETLIFLERLRKARGLAPRSKYPAELVQVEPMLEGLSNALSRSTTYAIVDWTPLVDVVDFWQSSCQVTILVDWRELARVDRRPFSTLVTSVEQLAWRDALDSSLTPLGMAWVPVDGQTLQITSTAAAHNHQWVEFYTAAQLTRLPDKSRTADGLREALAEMCQVGSMAEAVLADDPASGRILVRGNREIHSAILKFREGT
jgi:hypothetical protein